MRCNQISAIKDKPTGYSIETSSFRFVQFLKKRQNLIAISGDELESWFPKTKAFFERYFACQFGPNGGWADPGTLFCLGWQTTGDGDPWTVKSPGVGTKKRGQMPHPPSRLQHFLLIAQSNSAVLNILMCDFLFQLTSCYLFPLR